MKLIDDLAGVSPASANFPVGTVVISGDGAGDQTVESLEVKVLVGWVQARSAPTGGQAKQQVVAQANRSQASKTIPSPESECGGRRRMPKPLVQVEGQCVRRSTGYMLPKNSPWSRRTTWCERASMKAQNQSWVA